MASRKSLHEELETILGSSYVYFNPPESIKLHYPCFVYGLDYIKSDFADNSNYNLTNRYSVKYIDKNPDNLIIKNILKKFSLIRFDRTFCSDGLYHYVYSLYY